MLRKAAISVMAAISMRKPSVALSGGKEEILTHREEAGCSDTGFLHHCEWRVPAKRPLGPLSSVIFKRASFSSILQLLLAHLKTREGQ